MKAIFITLVLMLSTVSFAASPEYANKQISDLRSFRSSKDFTFYRYMVLVYEIYPHLIIEAIEPGKTEGDESRIVLSANVTEAISKKYKNDFIHLQHAKDAVNNFTEVDGEAELTIKIIGSRVGKMTCTVKFNLKDFKINCKY